MTDRQHSLVARFFEAMHPVYPFLHRRSFYTRYERFWSSSPSERLKADADMLALHYTVYALGTQFMELPSYRDAAASAEFYGMLKSHAGPTLTDVCVKPLPRIRPYGYTRTSIEPHWNRSRRCLCWLIF